MKEDGKGNKEGRIVNQCFLNEKESASAFYSTKRYIDLEILSCVTLGLGVY